MIMNDPFWTTLFNEKKRKFITCILEFGSHSNVVREFDIPMCGLK